MHGGAKGSGGPLGKRNGSFRHGLFTRKAKIIRAKMRAILQEIKALNEFDQSELLSRPLYDVLEDQIDDPGTVGASRQGLPGPHLQLIGL